MVICLFNNGLLSGFSLSTTICSYFMLQLELLDGYTVIILNLTKLEKIVTLSFATNKDFTSFGSSKILLKGRGGFPITLLFICYTFVLLRCQFHGKYLVQEDNISKTNQQLLTHIIHNHLKSYICKYLVYESCLY